MLFFLTRSTLWIVPAILLTIAASGCAADIMKADVLRPVETKLTFYKTVEVPAPEIAKGVPPISEELQQRLINELLLIGKFKHVRPSISPEEEDVLVIQAKVKKWDQGSNFLRWWGSILDFGSNVYEQYTKQQIGNMSGTIGDAYLIVNFKLVDRQTKDLVGEVLVRGMSDDPDSPRSGEDRAIHSLITYMKRRIEAMKPSAIETNLPR